MSLFVGIMCGSHHYCVTNRLQTNDLSEDLWGCYAEHRTCLHLLYNKVDLQRLLRIDTALQNHVFTLKCVKQSIPIQPETIYWKKHHTATRHFEIQTTTFQSTLTDIRQNDCILVDLSRMKENNILTFYWYIAFSSVILKLFGSHSILVDWFECICWNFA